MQTLVLILELIGTVAFAISGAMTALKKHMDIFGVAILGVVTAVGGGAIRDIVLGITPPDGGYTSSASVPSAPSPQGEGFRRCVLSLPLEGKVVERSETG